MDLYTLLQDVSGSLLRRSYIELPLPTELVVKRPEFVVPKMARVYSTGLYMVDDVLVSYKELLDLRGRDFKGTSYEIEVNLWEVFEDHGEDGHVDYRLVGWVLLPSTALTPDRYPGCGVAWPDRCKF